MKHNKHDIISYVNEKKKVITAKIIEITDNECTKDIVESWGLTHEHREMYLTKTVKNGKINCKFEEDVTLVENTRLKKLERILYGKD